jgi:hypothetical protein
MFSFLQKLFSNTKPTQTEAPAPAAPEKVEAPCCVDEPVVQPAPAAKKPRKPRTKKPAVK